MSDAMHEGFYAYCGCGWKLAHADRKEAWRRLDEHWKRYFPAVGVGTVQSFRSRWVPIGTTWRDR